MTSESIFARIFPLLLIPPHASFAMTTSSSISTNDPATTITTSNKGGLPFPEMQPADTSSVVVTENGTLRSVPTKMNYVTPSTQEAHVHRDASGTDHGISGVQWDPVQVQVQNARGQQDNIKRLDQHGFELLESPINKDGPPLDFLDTEQVIDRYYPHCEALLKQVLGGPDNKNKVAMVKAFDHNIRISDGGSSNDGDLKGGGQAKTQGPVGVVHGDYTETSGPKRLHDLGQPPKANDVLKERLGETPLLDPDMVQNILDGKQQQGKGRRQRRFALINVWRNIDPEHPIPRLPLACVDATTVSPDDLRIFKIHYPDRVGQNYFVAPSHQHEWNYFPQMTHGEALLIKQWDSFGDFALSNHHKEQDDTTKNNGLSTFALHSAFLDPTTKENAPPRRSIEVRCAIIWEEDEEA
jgi:hypothetical protein